MKNWLKILRGDVELSSKKIRIEIANLENQREEKINERKNFTAELKAARLDQLGGVENFKKIIPLEKSFLKSKEDSEVLKDAIFELSTKLSQALENEALHEVQSIDGEISGFEAELFLLREKFMRLTGEAAGLWSIISNTGSFKAGKGTYPIGIEGNNMREPFDEAFQKGKAGRKHIQNSILELRRKKNVLIEKLDVGKKGSVKEQ